MIPCTQINHVYHVLIYSIKGYETLYDYDSNEDAFNQAFVWPYLDLIGKTLNNNNCKDYFVQGQPCLESMTWQLKATGATVDETSQYKSDGLIKLFGLKNLELLLLETSGHFSNTDKVKLSLIIIKACMVSSRCLSVLLMISLLLQLRHSVRWKFFSCRLQVIYYSYQTL